MTKGKAFGFFRLKKVAHSFISCSWFLEVLSGFVWVAVESGGGDDDDDSWALKQLKLVQRMVREL